MKPSRRRCAQRRPISDINITPFVDVMLVLLVVFMVTAPLLNVGVKVDLPQTQALPIREKEPPLNVVVTAEGNIYLNGPHGDTQLSVETLVPKLLAITNANAEAQIYIHGSQQLSYGRILEIMSLMNRAGFKHLVLVAEPAKKGQVPHARPQR
ncbi:MAG: biopolymer transporter ExbD [Holosporales bacterium]|jgi:biopolymer transport protein TolR|nr:biopolymer transporter ExbD [Holosporales bacterium]